MTPSTELEQLAAELERCGLHDAHDPGEQLLVQRLVDLAASLPVRAHAVDALRDPTAPAVVRERAAVAVVAAVRSTARAHRAQLAAPADDLVGDPVAGPVAAHRLLATA